MTSPNMELAARFLQEQQPPGRLLLCGVTGSHQYGFPSPDSDIDLKGIHLAPAAEWLGLGTPRETFDRLQPFEGVECDLTTHEAKKAFGLLLRGNGNMLERIESPFQIVESADLDTLRSISRRLLSKRFAGHYRGFFTGMCREYECGNPRQAKPMLYSYRVALTGVHLLRTGELECDLNRLAPEYGFDEVLPLIEKKRSTKEHVSMTDDEDREHLAAWPRLEQALTDALSASKLPPEPVGRDELSDWLVELRSRPNHS